MTNPSQPDPVPDTTGAPRFQPGNQLRKAIAFRLPNTGGIKLTELCRMLPEGGWVYTADEVLTELRAMEDEGIAHSYVHGGDLIERFSSTPYGRGGIRGA